MSILQSPDHTYHAIGTYPVTLYASTVNGCIDSAFGEVVIKDVITCYIPNSFTPNKNGINDTFNIYSYGLSPDNFLLMIFDRWGNRVFKTNDLHEGWNGGMNNGSVALDPAVYVYHLDYQEINGKKHTLTGLVSLVR
jgi:gliding motility-associated-like protein